MSNLHLIDTPRKSWTDIELQRYMVFCILDSNEPYARVCKTFDAIFADHEPLVHSSNFYLVPKWLQLLGKREVHKRIKKAGYHYHNQITRYLYRWAEGEHSNPAYLRTALRDELVHDIKGVSWKLASMYLRGTRGLQYAVIDRYIRRFLVGKGYMGPQSGGKGYKLMEKRFIEIAHDMDMSPYDLDLKIWEEQRV